MHSEIKICSENNHDPTKRGIIAAFYKKQPEHTTYVLKFSLVISIM